MIDDLLGIIEQNNGALLLAATLLLAWFTLRLATEAQLARLSAVVVLQPMIWPRNETVLHLYLSNVGQSAARDVTLTFRWLGPEAKLIREDRVIRLPALVPGERIPYHPDVILERQDRQPMSLDRLAEQRLTLEAFWSWTDGRRPLWLVGRKRNADTLRIDTASFRDGVYNGPQIMVPDAVDRLLEGARNEIRTERAYQSLRDDLIPFGDDTTIPGTPGRRARTRRTARVRKSGGPAEDN